MRYTVYLAAAKSIAVSKCCAYHSETLKLVTVITPICLVFYPCSVNIVLGGECDDFTTHLLSPHIFCSGPYTRQFELFNMEKKYCC